MPLLPPPPPPPFGSALESVFSKKNQFSLRMRQERAMGVLPRLKGRFVLMVGQNALFFFENTNSVIMLKSYLISRFKYYIYRQPCLL